MTFVKDNRSLDGTAWLIGEQSWVRRKLMKLRTPLSTTLWLLGGIGFFGLAAKYTLDQPWILLLLQLVAVVMCCAAVYICWLTIKQRIRPASKHQRLIYKGAEPMYYIVFVPCVLANWQAVDAKPLIDEFFETARDERLQAGGDVWMAQPGSKAGFATLKQLAKQIGELCHAGDEIEKNLDDYRSIQLNVERAELSNQLAAAQKVDDEREITSLLTLRSYIDDLLDPPPYMRHF
jgi:uncharacterized membrane protein SirB2